MTRFPVMVERDDGWTDWIHPLVRGYRLACCDCGLVHDMEFQAVRVKDEKGAYFTYGELDAGKYRVRFRARRNNRSTAQLRRKRKHAD